MRPISTSSTKADAIARDRGRSRHRAGDPRAPRGRAPGDGVFGEEFGVTGDSARQWIIDPIDGTANYLKGIPMWTMLIALAIDGVPRVGVASQPALGRRWWAATGLGAWTNTPTASRRDSRVDGRHDRRRERELPEHRAVGRGRQARRSSIRLSRAVWRDRGYGDTWPYMLLAEGRLEFVAEFGVKEYDIAALVPIITEAGGRFTSFDGNDSISERSALATNGILHDAFLDLLHSPDPSAPPIPSRRPLDDPPLARLGAALVLALAADRSRPRAPRAAPEPDRSPSRPRGTPERARARALGRADRGDAAPARIRPATRSSPTRSSPTSRASAGPRTPMPFYIGELEIARAACSACGRDFEGRPATTCRSSAGRRSTRTTQPRRRSDARRRRAGCREDAAEGVYVTESPETAIATDEEGYGMTYLFGDGWVKLADTKQGLLLIEWPPA